MRLSASVFISSVLCATVSAAEQGSLDGAILREGTRAAAQSQSLRDRVADAAWVGVRLVPGGRDVQVTRRQEPPRARVFVTADEAGLTVLNLSDPPLPRTARRVLRQLAAAHPDWLLAADRAYTEDTVRLERDGVFVGSRLVADRAHLVEHIDRGALQQLRYIGPGGSYWQRGLLVGLAGGALIGYAAGSRCGPGAAPSECSFYGMVLGTVGAGVGAAVGVGIGASIDRPSAAIIYSVP
jgi:hypothetical protein